MKKIYIQVKTNAKEKKVEKLQEDKFKVSVTESPEKGKANKAVIKVLADYFDVSQNRVEIKAGHTSKSKIIELK
ncbi:MAG: DUF167 domain-containing protein [Candidatus Paceibacterota bacterium]